MNKEQQDIFDNAAFLEIKPNAFISFRLIKSNNVILNNNDSVIGTWKYGINDDIIMSFNDGNKVSVPIKSFYL